MQIKNYYILYMIKKYLVYILSTGDVDYPYLLISATGWDGTRFYVDIFNPTDQDQTIKLDFFDQIVTDDGEYNKACDRIHSIDDLWSNLIWDKDSFVVSANSWLTKTIVMDYNYCSSWVFVGCAVLMPSEDIDAGSFDISLGKANFIDMEISRDIANCNKYTVKMIPWYRNQSSDYKSTWYMSYRIGDDFQSMSYDNMNSSWLVDFSGNGIAEFMYPFPDNWSGFFVLLKLKWYLSVWYTWIFDISSSDMIDFTNKISLLDYVYNSWWYNKFYLYDLPEEHWLQWDKSVLVPWDINNNDYIWAADLALVNHNMTVSFATVNPDYDLDQDGYISSKDQSILIDWISRNWFWNYFKNQLMSGMDVANDPIIDYDNLPWDF